MTTTISARTAHDPFSRIDSLLDRARTLAERKRAANPAGQATTRDDNVTLRDLPGVPVRPAADEADQAYGEVLRLLGNSAADVHGGLDPSRVARLLDL